MKKRYDDVHGREGETLYDAVCHEGDGRGYGPLDDYLQRDAEYQAKEQAALVAEECKADPKLKAWWAGRLHVSQDGIDAWDPADDAAREKLAEDFYQTASEWAWDDFQGQFKKAPDADVAVALGIPGRVTHWSDPNTGRWLEVGDVYDACPGCHELFFGDEDIAAGDPDAGEPRAYCPRCEEPVPPCPGCVRKEAPNGLAHVTHGCLRERRTEAAFKEIGFA